VRGGYSAAVPIPTHDTPFDETPPAEPLGLVESWLTAAREAGIRNWNAVALATVDEAQRPEARTVLLRGFDAELGFAVVYTDRDSAKGRQLAAQPQAALVFYWEAIERQLRIAGPVVHSPAAESEGYFASRPVGSQVSAIASLQSRPTASRADLIARRDAVAREHGVEVDDMGPGRLPRPERWGGYRIWAERVEFWLGQPSRLHDRLHYERALKPEGNAFRGGPWSCTRLDP